ncbi:MAG: preprotein translocase subunit SecD [Myxococcota bacterium]
MEGVYWIRLSAIAAMVLGSLYVLAPTILQDDIETRLGNTAGQVEAPSKAGPDLDVVFDVDAGGDSVRAAEVLRGRLAAAGVPTDKVHAKGGTVVVRVGPGGDKASVRRLAALPGLVRFLLPPAALLPTEEPPPEAPEGTVLPGDLATLLADAGVDLASAAESLTRLSGSAPPPGTIVAPVRVDSVAAGESTRILWKGAFPDGVPLVLVDVDGTVVAVAAASGDVTWLTTDPGDAAAVLASGPVGAGLTPRPEAPVGLEEAPDVAVASPSMIPDWVLGMLPNTAMSLGLDLQGGIDLTLQVVLEEAVLGQATRDATFLRERAKTDGLVFEQVRRDRVGPIIWVTTEVPLGDVQDYMLQQLSQYVYSTSDGNRHAFEMQSERVADVESQAVEQVLETLRKRVDETGVKEPSIVKKGDGRINVQLPGLVDVQQAVDAIGTTAMLEFRLRDHGFDDLLREQMVQAAEGALPAEQFEDDMLMNDWLWTTKRLDEDRIVMFQYTEQADGELVREYPPYVLFADVMLTGNDVNNARVGWDQNNQPYVSMEFKPRGSQVFCDVTTANVQKQFAIILDERVRSIPQIREPICGGAASIEMGASMNPLKDAQTLALVLRTGALDAPVVLAQVRQVGASLGQDSIRKGSIATVVGGSIVLVFMLLWYRRAGIVADIALVVNVLLVLAALAVFGATLTLPGIAGIALTIGMAVDANIIIYERIREELRLGVHPRKAVDVGFDKAVVAVLDANITTAIAGVVLFSYGTGPIKGFAVTLLIGIVTTLVTALFVTRTLLELSTRSSSARLRI